MIFRRFCGFAVACGQRRNLTGVELSDLLTSLTRTKWPKKAYRLKVSASVLEQSLKRLDLVARLDEYAVWPIWNEVVGAVIARNAQPERIRNGTLFVKVSSPVWMQQLQFMKDMIAGKLNHRLKGEVVKNIFFMVGRIEAQEEAAPAAQSETAEANDNPNQRGVFGIDCRRGHSRRVQKAAAKLFPSKTKKTEFDPPGARRSLEDAGAGMIYLRAPWIIAATSSV